MFSIVISVLRVLFVLFLVRLLVQFVVAVVRGYLGAGAPPKAGPARTAARRADAVELVRDPVCNTFVDPSRALSREVNGRRVYYCSAACRDQSLVLAAAR